MGSKAQKVLKKKGDLKPLKLRNVSSPGSVSAELSRMKRQIAKIAEMLDEDAGTIGTDYSDEQAKVE